MSPLCFPKKKKKGSINDMDGRKGAAAHAPLCRVQVLLAVHHPFLVRFERDDVAASSAISTTARVLAR